MAAEDMASVEGGVSNSPCKYALVFFVCARESERRVCYANCYVILIFCLLLDIFFNNVTFLADYLLKD